MLLYNFLIALYLITIGPILLIGYRLRGKPFPGIADRLGITNAPDFSGKSVTWFHACSVGETLSVVPLIGLFLSERPSESVLFTCITAGGYDVARARFSGQDRVTVRFFPFDLAHIQKRFMSAVRPEAIVTVDTEIWPNLITEAHRRHIPMVMINARISDRSFPKYMRVRNFMKMLLGRYALMLPTGDVDAERLVALGASPSRVGSTGNLKFDTNSLTPSGVEVTAFRNDLGMGTEPGKIITAGSTHPGEDRIVLNAFVALRSGNPDLRVRLIVAPRHTERASEVEKLCDELNITHRRRTVNTGNIEPDVMILDTIGELVYAYAISDAAVVCGSFVPIGGHSFFEPTSAGVPTVVGPYMQNFRGITETFIQTGGMKQIALKKSPHEMTERLTAVLAEILTNPQQAELMSKSAEQLLHVNRGTVRRTYERIAELLDARSKAIA